MKIDTTNQTSPSFSQLFKFFRIKSGFKTISEFADTLKKKGFNYNHSLFSHWQRGSRVPTNRKLVIALIQIFMETGSIEYEDQTNLLLKSTKKKSISLKEQGKLPVFETKQSLVSWKTELEEFILLENMSKKMKSKIGSHYNKISRFNFILSHDTYLYLEKTSAKKGISKADFLRGLIENHRNHNLNI